MDADIDPGRCMGRVGAVSSERARFEHIQKELTMFRAGWRAAEKEGNDPRKREQLVGMF